jgi:hypothetical protein
MCDNEISMQNQTKVGDLDITHTTEILGGKIMAVSGRGMSFWAVKLPSEDLMPGHIGQGTGQDCYCGNIDVGGGMTDVLEALNCWVAMKCRRDCDMTKSFPWALSQWAKKCYDENLFLLERDKVEEI